MITTSGFRLSNLARFTPVDQNLVAFQPTKVTEGALDALRLASTLQKYQSDKRKQEEENALQQQRMEAARAGYGAQAALGQKTMALAPREAEIALADFKVADELRQPKADLERSLLGSRSKDLAFNEAIRGDVEAAKKVEAETAAATAGLKAANTTSQLMNEGAALRSTAADLAFKDRVRPNVESAAELKAYQDAELTAMNWAARVNDAKIKEAELRNKLANFPEDSSVAREAEKAKVEKTKAEAELNRAQAELARMKPTIEQNKLAAKRELANTAEKQVQNLDKLAESALMQANRIGGQRIDDPFNPKGAPTTVNSLQTRIMEQDANGNWVVKTGIFKSTPPPQVLQLIKLYQDQLNEAEQYKDQARAARKRLQSALSDEPEIAKKEESSTGEQPSKIRLVLKPDGSLLHKQ